MKRRSIAFTLGILVAAQLLLPSVGGAAADLVMVADNGMFEHVYSSSGKAYKDTIQFVWIPEGPPGATVYGMVGSCKHLDLNIDFPVGNFKVIFKNVALLGIDSGTQVTGENGKSKVKNGIPSKYAIWELDEGAQFAGSDSGVLVTAQVTVRGNMAAGSYLQCFLGVVEGDAGLFTAASTAAEREAIFEELASLKFDPKPVPPAE